MKRFYFALFMKELYIIVFEDVYDKNKEASRMKIFLNIILLQ